MIFAKRNGQSFIEYVVLLTIVGASVVAMTAYLFKSTNARLKRSQLELDYYKQER